MRSYIVDIGEAKQVGVPNAAGKTVSLNRKYVLLNETGELSPKNGFPAYSLSLLEESALIAFVKQTPNLETVNYRVVNGKLTHPEKEASLTRFNQAGYREKPIVVLAEVRTEDNTLLGYLYSNCNGYTFSRKVAEFMQDCELLIERAAKTANTSEIKDDFKPIQNMKFISKNAKANKAGKSHLSIYNESNPLPVIKLKPVTNTYAVQQKETPKTTAKKASAKEIMDSIYTPKQLAELKAAKENGVDIKIISNPKLTPAQMNAVWTIEAQGLPGRKYAEPEYSEDFMKWLGIMLRCGVNIDYVLNPRYDKNQAIEILSGIREGLDVNVYANPDLDAEEMHRLRKDLSLGMWGEGLVYAGSKVQASQRRVIKQPLKKE